jgi:hypothetical protein
MNPLYRIRYDDMNYLHEVENHTAERLEDGTQMGLFSVACPKKAHKL